MGVEAGLAMARICKDSFCVLERRISLVESPVAFASEVSPELV